METKQGLELEFINCNLCGSSENKILFSKKGDMIKHWFNIVRCNRCNLTFVNPRLTVESIIRLYDADYYSGKGMGSSQVRYLCEDQSSDCTRSNFYLGQIEMFVPFKEGQDFLDIGCGLGDLVKQAGSKGYNAEGVEWSDFALNYLNKKNLNIHRGEFLQYDFGSRKYDVITAIEVLEHLTDPTSFFMKVYSLLKKNGLFYYQTGNIGRLSAKIKGRDWDYIIPEGHIHYFSNETIKQFLGKAGFRIISKRDLPLGYEGGRRAMRILKKYGLLNKLSYRLLRIREYITGFSLIPYGIKDCE